jgi:hypothetical protein
MPDDPGERSDLAAIERLGLGAASDGDARLDPQRVVFSLG